jgi:hypothetical protein
MNDPTIPTMFSSKVIVTNVDRDRFEVIIYDNKLNKIFQTTVDEFHVELYPKFKEKNHETL